MNSPVILLSEFFSTRTTLGDDTPRWGLFSLTHILLLAVCALFATLMGILYHKGNEKRRHILEWVVVGLMLAEEVWMFSIAIATGQFEMGFLPFQLCGINIFFCIAHAIWHKAWLEDFLYALALPGALIALLVPTWRSVPAWNFIFIFSSGYHIFLLAYPVMLLAGGFHPNLKNLWKVFLVLAALSGAMFGVNQFNAYMANATGNSVFWNSNFMFTYKSESILTTLANLLHLTGYWYLIELPILLLLVWAILYLPWLIVDRVKAKKA